MKKKIQWMIAILAMTSVPAAATTWDQYRVVLKDGSWLTAREKPQLVEDQGEALVRLPSGLMTIEETSRIDWQKTRAWNFQALYLRNVISDTTGVLSLSADDAYGEVILGVQEGQAVNDTQLALLADPVPPVDPITVKRNEILALAEQIGALKERKSVLEKAAAVTRTPRKAMQFRLEAEDLEDEIRALRSTQAQLILAMPRHSG